ncbi:hypothetical protein BGZ94_003455, partial [Podila epigama]
MESSISDLVSVNRQEMLTAISHAKETNPAVLTERTPHGAPLHEPAETGKRRQGVSYADLLKSGTTSTNSKDALRRSFKNARSFSDNNNNDNDNDNANAVTVGTTTTTDLSDKGRENPPTFFTKSKAPNKAKIFFGHTALLPHQVLQGLNTIEGLWTAVINKVGEATARFQTREDVDKFINNDLFINGVRVRHTRCTPTKGRILTIRATTISFGALEDTRQYLRGIFAPFGTILHFDFSPLSTSPPRYHPTIDFVLDIKEMEEKDILIPRLQALGDENCLFTWPNMGPVCFTCGSDAHVKAHCPHPQDDFRKSALLREAQLSRTFPPITEKVPSNGWTEVKRNRKKAAAPSAPSVFSFTAPSQPTGVVRKTLATSTPLPKHNNPPSPKGNKQALPTKDASKEASKDNLPVPWGGHTMG